MAFPNKPSEFSLQSLGYGAGLLAVPVFFLVSHFFGEKVGLGVGIVTAFSLLAILRIFTKRD